MHDLHTEHVLRVQQKLFLVFDVYIWRSLGMICTFMHDLHTDHVHIVQTKQTVLFVLFAHTCMCVYFCLNKGYSWRLMPIFGVLWV